MGVIMKLKYIYIYIYILNCKHEWQEKSVIMERAIKIRDTVELYPKHIQAVFILHYSGVSNIWLWNISSSLLSKNKKFINMIMICLARWFNYSGVVTLTASQVQI